MSNDLARSLQLAFLNAICACQVAVAAPTCIPLAGTVRLVPEFPCQVIAKVSGPFIGAPGTCFSVAVRGLFGNVIGTGSAGLTLEGHYSPIVSSGGATPSILNEAGLTPFTNEFGIPETRRFITGRSAIDIFGGRLFSADAGVIGGAGSTEQLLITGGTGPWVGATGVLYTSGDIIGNWAPFAGKVCKP